MESLSPRSLVRHIPVSAIYQDRRFGFRHGAGFIDYHVAITTPELDQQGVWEELAEFAFTERLPVKVIGSATNLYVTKEGYRGLLVSHSYDAPSNARASTLLAVDTDRRVAVCPSGLSFASLVKRVCLEHHGAWGNLAGIPGTVGGATLGNAGRTVTRNYFGDRVTHVTAFDLQTGREVTLDPGRFTAGEPFFQERSSLLKRWNFPTSRYVIRSVGVALGEPAHDAADLYRRRYDEREGSAGKNQEGRGTAGSIFVNSKVPLGIPKLVRQLILETDIVGLKLADLKVNGAGFTPGHAFLTTAPWTRDHDVAELLYVTIDVLRTLYGFTPVLEIDIVGPHGSMTAAQFIGQYQTLEVHAPAEQVSIAPMQTGINA